MRLAQSLCQQKKWQDALAIAAKIESEFPRFEEQYEADYIVGRCLAAEAEFAAAREAYGKVIRSKGNEKSETAAKAQLMIAETYLHQKDYAAALREYLRVELLYAYPTEQAKRSSWEAGKCHELLGEWKEATGVYAPDSELPGYKVRQGGFRSSEDLPAAGGKSAGGLTRGRKRESSCA